MSDFEQVKSEYLALAKEIYEARVNNPYAFLTDPTEQDRRLLKAAENSVRQRQIRLNYLEAVLACHHRVHSVRQCVLLEQIVELLARPDSIGFERAAERFNENKEQEQE